MVGGGCPTRRSLAGHKATGGRKMNTFNDPITKARPDDGLGWTKGCPLDTG